MKNILILGVGRAGKTTLGEMIKEKYKSYNLLHTDSIRCAFLRTMPEYVTEAKFDNFEENKIFQTFIVEYFNSQIRQSKEKLNYILEGAQVSPEVINNYIDLKNTVVFFLGHGNLTSQQIFDLCRKNDTSLDFSYNKTDDELLEYAERWYKNNEFLKKECKKYNFEYIDTSKNRNEILQEILSQIQL